MAVVTIAVVAAAGRLDANIYKLEDFGQDLLPPLMDLAPNEEPEIIAALQLLKNNDTDGAIAALKAFLERKPDSDKGHELLGVLYGIRQDLDRSLAEFRTAVQLNPSRVSAMTKIADILMAKGDEAGARAQLRRALDIDPKDRWANQRMGMILAREGAAGEAARHLELGIQGTPPDYIGVKVTLANLYNGLSAFPLAIALLQPVIGPESRHAPGLIALGAAHMGAGDTERALALLEQACRVAPDSREAGIALAAGLREAGRFQDSIDQLRAMETKEPRMADVRVQLAETLAAMGRIPEALATYRSAIELGGDETVLKNRSADLLRRNNQPDAARGIYEQLVADGKASWGTYDRLAGLLEGSDEFAEAERILLRGLEVNPGQPAPLHRLGMHYGLRKDYDKAIAYFERARTLAPADPQMLHTLVIAFGRAGRSTEELEYARKLVELTPGNAGSLFLLASILEDRGNDREAAEIYQAALRINPSHAPSLNNLASVRLREGNHREAVALAAQAEKLDPENGFILDTSGWAKFKSGDLKGARQSLEKAVAQPAASPAWHYHLAVVYEKLNEKSLAVESVRRALQSGVSFPGREEAQELLRRLGG